MTGVRAVVGALLLAHASAVGGQVHEGKTIVTARLVADTVRAQPGRPFTAGVHLSVAPGWHVYWQNPGDTALPIQVAWELPDGGTASPLQWPAPEKYQEEGGVTVFGYERETLLMSRISPPRSIPGESLTIEAKADWLVCEKLCIPGEAALTLTLPAGTTTPSNDAPLIERFRRTVPASGERAGVRITRANSRKKGDRSLFTLIFETNGRRIIRFFPRSIDGFLIDHGAIMVRGNAVEFTAQPDEPGFTARRVSGVVATDRGNFDVAAQIGEDGDKAAAIPTSPPVAPKSSGPDVVAGPLPGPALPVTGTNWLARDFTNKGPSRELPMAKLFLFAALGGLLLNIMPCVLPVISLKILSFMHQAGHDARRTRLMGLIFAAGVLVSFWILVAAVAVIRATAQQVGWGFQFQSPAFVLVMSVIVLVFAMNLFGVFEISGPVLSGSAAGGGEGPAGAFVHGMLATILATPCTAPFLGTAIGFAFTQSLPVLFLAFTATGAGLALPYVLLAWNPAWLRWVPKPGAWMIRFKQAMGFVLLGTVVWLLSVLAAQLGPEGVVWSLVFLTIVAFAVWMAGQVPGHAGGFARVLWRLSALLIIVAGYFWALEYELRWREPAGQGAEVVRSGGLRWEKFSLAGLQERVERGETVFIDFTADWCWSCKVNERTVLATSRVEQRFRELKVTAMKADWTRRNPEITLLLAKFGRVGVPYYVVFPARQLTHPIALSEVITPGSVIDALNRAGASRRDPSQ